MIKHRATYVWLISGIAALGGLLFGYDFVVIGGAKPFFERYFELKDAATSGWVNSCALIGCLFGALAAGALSDKFGRKRLLMLSALLFVVTSLGNAHASSLTVFVVWRMLGGSAIGLASALSPIYIAEVAPAAMRGKLVLLNQLTIIVGIVLAQLVNWFVARHLPAHAGDEFIRTSWYGQSAWRWMFGLTAVPACLFFLAMFFVPESPRWLAKNGNPDGARAVFAAVAGAEFAETEMRSVQSTLAAEEIRHVRFRDLLEPELRTPLVLGVVLAVFQQWCGINVIFNYAEEIFHGAGYDISNVLENIAWTGSVALVFTIVALGLIDRVGRRPLMLLGAASLAITNGAIGYCYYRGIHGTVILLAVLLSMACFAMTLGPVTWNVISEIFPNRIRGAATAVAVTSLWAACFTLTYTFPILNRALGAAGTFWIYGAICVAGFLFILRALPETRGKSLETIEREMAERRKT